MKINTVSYNKISFDNKPKKTPSFSSCYLLLTEKNRGIEMQKNVLDYFNKNMLPQLIENRLSESKKIFKNRKITDKIRAVEDLVEKVDFFVLGGGAGKRFQEISKKVGEYTKIDMPINLPDGKILHPVDFALVLGKYCVDCSGIKSIISSQENNGALGGLIEHYLQGNPIKDTIILCGDNVFDNRVNTITKFFVDAINNPNTHYAAAVVKKPFSEIIRTTGLLSVDRNFWGEIKFKDYLPKNKVTNDLGISQSAQCIASTGLSYISKEAMEKIIADLKLNPDIIKSNPNGEYKLSDAFKYIQANVKTWFGVEPSEGIKLKLVGKWEDIGEAKHFYDFAKEVNKGYYLKNFPDNTAKNILLAFQNRFRFDDKMPMVVLGENFSHFSQVPKELLDKSTKVSGVYVIT